MNDHAQNTRADVPDPDKLEELIESCLDRLEASDSGALDEFCRNHPLYADALRRNVGRLIELGLARPHKMPDLGEVGPYRIVRELGRGGMGVVYEAERAGESRHFAVKVLRHAEIDVPALRERFRREIDALSRLEHPGIVKIEDWGESSTSPFIAMELVAGKTAAEILRTPEAERGANFSGRDLAKLLVDGGADSTVGDAAGIFVGDWTTCVLRIVRDAALAVDHVHERGIVHRDLKPSNIMITPNGRVVILDFGLAFLGDVTRMTRSQAMLGSLPYMAPEQLLGKNVGVDRRSDVYALGVTLYELLTFVSPFRRDTGERTRLAIVDGEKQSPKELRPSMPTDVETVVLTAIERDPERRYGSAKALADDIDRVLVGRPIRAKRASALRLLVDRAKRRPTATVATLLFLLIVVGGPLVFAIQERRASRAIERARDDAARDRDLAELRFSAAERAVDRMLVHVAEARLSEMPGMQPLRKKLLSEALAIYEDLLKSAAGKQRVVRRRATVLTRAGRLNLELGDYERATEMLDEAIRSFESEKANGPFDDAATDAFVDAYDHRGRIENARKNRAAARRFLEKCLAVAEDASKERSSRAWMRKVGDACNNLAMVVADDGDLERARSLIDRAVAIDEEIDSESSRKFTYSASLARILIQMGRIDEATKLAEKTIAGWSTYLDEHPTDHPARSELVATANNQGQICMRKEDWKGAEKLFLTAARHAEIMTRQEPLIVRYALREANAQTFLAGLYSLTQRADLAEAAGEKALAILEPHRLRDPLDLEIRDAFGGAAMNLALTQYGQKKYPEALRSFRNAADAFRDILATDADDPSTAENLVAVLTNAGALAARLGRLEDAEKHLREAFDAARSAIGRGRWRSPPLELARQIHRTLVETVIDQRRLDDAVRLAESLPTIDDDWTTAFDAALEFLSLARSVAKFSMNDADRPATAERFRARAVDLLKLAAKRGCPQIATWENDRSLDDLMGRDDFESLLDDVLP